jgi:predicted RNA-binding protein with PIN domain
MPYLIDGHNLIPAIGLRLDDPHDEAKLIALLRRFSARSGKPVTVYFDRRAPGASQPPDAGGLTIRFVSAPATADVAIRRHLARLRSQTPNWTVVSSDHEVQNQARLAGARVLSAPAFAHRMQTGAQTPSAAEKPEEQWTAAELAELEREFTRRRRGQGGS